MAKKSRRARKQGQNIRLSPAQMVQPGEGGMVKESDVFASAQSVSKVIDLREEYRYVITDLRRIGIIAVAMLAVLIVLALTLT